MKVYKQALFISIIGSLLLLSAVSKVHAAGTVHFFLSGGGLVEDLQSFEYVNSDSSQDPDSEFGGAVLLDFIFNERHALAVDFYSFTEEFEFNPNRRILLENGRTITLSDNTDEAQSLLIGYRHHFPFGFYLGGGILATDLSSDYTVVSGVGGNFKFEFESATPLALTLGYQTAFANGLSLGTHLLYSLPTDIKADTLTVNVNTGGSATDSIPGEVEDFSIQSLGFIIGYAWGGNS